MSKILVSLLCVFAMGCAVTVCATEPLYGVITEERIINLPNDQGKWYVSIVGNTKDANYQKIIGWFDTNEKLMKLKDQVHFLPVTEDTVIYTERYADTVDGLPTVRVQTGDGVVVYEAAGDNIPMSAEGLNGAIAEGVLPWRKRVDDRCGPRPCPSPSPSPSPVTPLDPEPQPLIDVDVPDMDPPPRRGLANVVVVLLLVSSSVIGGVTGLAVEWSKPRRK